MESSRTQQSIVYQLIKIPSFPFLTPHLGLAYSISLGLPWPQRWQLFLQVGVKLFKHFLCFLKFFFCLNQNETGDFWNHYDITKPNYFCVVFLVGLLQFLLTKDVTQSHTMEANTGFAVPSVSSREQVRSQTGLLCERGWACLPHEPKYLIHIYQID